MATIPNKRSLQIAVTQDPGYPGPNAGNQGTQFFHIPESQHYTDFAVQVDAGAGVLSDIYGSLSGPIAVNGVAGGAGAGVVNNGLALATGYGNVHLNVSSQNQQISPESSVGVVNQFSIRVPMKGGIVLEVGSIDSDGTIHVSMSNSKFSASL